MSHILPTLGHFVSTLVLRHLPALLCANAAGKIYTLFTFSSLFIKSFLTVNKPYFKNVLRRPLTLQAKHIQMQRPMQLLVLTAVLK